MPTGPVRPVAALFLAFAVFSPFFSIAGRPLDSLIPSNKNEDAFQLLLGMLELNTQLRLTATQALDHAFLDIVPAIPVTTDSPKNGASAENRIGPTGERANDFR